MSFDPTATAKILRSRINTEKPKAASLELMLESALRDAYEAARVPGTLTPDQQERAIRVLLFMACSGCSFASDRSFRGGSCAEESGRGFNCFGCDARELVQSLGYVEDTHGHWVKSQSA